MPTRLHQESRGKSARSVSFTPIIAGDGPPRMGKQPTGSGGEPSSPNCETSAEIRLVTFSWKALSTRALSSTKGSPPQKIIPIAQAGTGRFRDPVAHQPRQLRNCISSSAACPISRSSNASSACCASWLWSVFAVSRTSASSKALASKSPLFTSGKAR